MGMSRRGPIASISPDRWLSTMLLRMRSVTTALLGLIAAIGLGLVAFISQQGWTDVLDGAIPDPPVELRISHDANAGSARAPAEGRAERRGRRGEVTSRLKQSAGSGSAESGVSGSRQVAAVPAPSPGGVEGGNPGGRAPSHPQPTAQAPNSPSPAAPSPPTTAPRQSDSKSSAGSRESHGQAERSRRGSSSFGRSNGRSHSKQKHSAPAGHDSYPAPSSPSWAEDATPEGQGNGGKGHGNGGKRSAGKSDWDR
jgi:hypothetical protein